MRTSTCCSPKRQSLPTAQVTPTLPMSPRKRRISVDDVLSGNFSNTAKSLCSPSTYATKKFFENSNSENVSDNEETGGSGAGGLLSGSEAPSPSRPCRSQCLQGIH